MILFSTDAQRHEKEQAELRRRINGVRKFRMIAKLADGRYVLFEHVWEYTHGGIDRQGQLFSWSGSPDTDSPMVDRYLTESDEHINLTMGEGATHERLKGVRA